MLLGVAVWGAPLCGLTGGPLGRRRTCEPSELEANVCMAINAIQWILATSHGDPTANCGVAQRRGGLALALEGSAHTGSEGLARAALRQPHHLCR